MSALTSMVESASMAGSAPVVDPVSSSALVRRKREANEIILSAS
nr:hypothetical protein [Kibdelosporangium sp. MJ126-NF4]